MNSGSLRQNRISANKQRSVCSACVVCEDWGGYVREQKCYG